MIKEFYYFERKYKLLDDNTLIRCAFSEIRKSKNQYGYYKVNRYNKEKIITPFIDEDGYANVTLYCKGNQRTFRLHHLIYMIKIQHKNIIHNENIGYDFKTHNYIQINHKDGNKLNNDEDNLELVTLQNNINHAVKKKLHNSQIKAKYIDIFKKGEYIGTVWKLKQLSEFLTGDKNKINTGTLSSYIKNNKEYMGYTFQYKV